MMMMMMICQRLTTNRLSGRANPWVGHIRLAIPTQDFTSL